MLAVNSKSEQKLLSFAHYLRSHEFNISITEIKDSITSLSELSEPDKVFSQHILRSLFCNNIDDWKAFNALFNQYWSGQELIYSKKNTITNQTTQLKSSQSNTGFSGSSELQQNNIDNSDLKGAGAGKQNTLSKADFRFITDKQAMRKVEDLAEKLSISIGRKQRQLKISKLLGKKIDLRNTIRANLASHSLLFNRYYKDTKKKPPQLIVFHDISHSMSWNNPLLFRFARGLLKSFRNSHAFAFHTDLFQVTDIYKLYSLNLMREKMEQSNRLWLGGTSIASSLEKYIEQYFETVQKNNSIIIIISDGFDTDSPDQLAKALNKISRHSKKIFWLSPMLSNPSYNPDTETLRAASEYITALLPCSSLHNLENAIKHIMAYY